MKLYLVLLKPNLLAATALIGGVLLMRPFTGRADTYVITNTVADAFLASGPTGNLAANNYGGAGTLAIAPASSAKGEFNSVIKFNTAGAVNQFNTTYGAGNWQITGLTLSLASNAGTNGANPGNAIFNTISNGSFGIKWLSFDAWVEGSGSPSSPSGTGVNFNSISTLLAGSFSLGTFTYTPPGNNVYANYLLPLNASLVADAATGGDVSLYFFAADNQISYLFNSRTFAGNNPQLVVTAVPEPGLIGFSAATFACLLFRRRNEK